MSNYKRKEVMDYLTRKPITTQDIELARTRIQPLATRIEQPETDYQTEVQPDMVIPPQDVLPKNPEPVMPFAPGIPNPQDRILELADGGRIELAGGGDPEKIARIKELVESGKYNKTQIIDLLRKEGYGRTRTGKDSLVNKIADDLEVNLPQGLSKEGFSAHEAKGKYLPFYNNQKLKIDLENGKTLQDIGKELYKNNKKFYNNIGITENNISVLNNAISSKIRKNEDFISLHDANVNKNIKQQKQVLKDVDSFIKNNKQKYLNLYNQNKIGAPTQFKNDLIDFIEKKHPDYVKITTTYNPKNPLPKGSKVLDLPDIHEREITRAGDYGRDVYLKKKIRESLGIPERPLKGEGITKERLDRQYNITTQELLKKAQEEGVIPKTYTTKTGVKVPINNETSYYKYAKQMGVDPINKLFEGQVQFGLEHVGGIARAGKINDYETLNKALAFDSYTNRFIKGNSFDSRLTTLIELAKQAEPTKAKEYVKTINNLVTKAEEQYGIPLTRYKVVKDEITAVHPDISLTDSNFKKSKLAINSFITNDGLNHPNFEKLDTDLQKTIVNYSKDKTKEADDLLKGLLKQKGLSAEIIPGMRSIIDSKIFNNLVEAGSPAVNSIIKNSSNISKTTGLPFNAALGALLNFDEMQEKGLSVPDSIKYGAIKGAVDDVLNFGAQIISAGPLMTKTLFDATIAAKQQPPEGIDSFDQIGGKQSLQGKVLNEIFNIAPFQVTNMFATEKAKELPTKERIDNLVNFETRKIMEQLYSAPNISETEVPEQNNIIQQQEQEIKKNLYQRYFEDPKIKEEYEKTESLKKDPSQNLMLGPIVFPKYTQEELNFARGGRVKFANGSDDPKSDLYIPPLNEKEVSGINILKEGKEGIDGLYFRTREEQRPIPVDPMTGKPISSGGMRELKQVFSSLLSDTRPEAGYRKGNIDFYASKGINPFQGDTDFKYGASYTPEGNVGKFMIDKTPQYLGAGYNYQKDGLDFGITGLKDERGDKSIALRFGYNYATGGRVGFGDGSKDPNKLIPIDPLLQDQSPTDPGRRDVLKLGIAGAGLLGLGKLGLLKLGSVAKPSIIAEAVKGTTAPSWMDSLITKILAEGTEIKMPKYETEAGYIKKEIQFKNPETNNTQKATLTIDPINDKISIEYYSPTNVAEQPVLLELKREIKFVDNPGGKSFSTKPDKTKGYRFETTEAGPRVVDWDGNIEFDAEDSYKKIIELKSDISGLKSYATEGKGINKKVAQEKRAATKDVEENPHEYVPDNYPDTKYWPND